jgi:energy-coupling factor transport system permease protein
MNDSFHPLAWLTWLAAAVLPALTTRNPLYLILVLLAATANYAALSRRNPLARSWGAFVRFSLFLWLLTIPFTALMAHYGTIVLFRLPRSWPLIGGPVTGEAVLFGLISGLALVTLLLVFAVFNVAVDQARLLRMVPGFVYQVGIIAAIGVAFVPQMVAAWQAIREAQQVRGHHLRGVRDLLPLIIPLLVMALERAMQLAESMEARGFGGQISEASGRQRAVAQLAILGGLGMLGAGLTGMVFWPDRRILTGLLAAGGVALMTWAFWDQSRRVRRSRYQNWFWGRADHIVLVVSLLAASCWMAVWLAQEDWLFFYPYPPYSPWPAFQPLLGAAILLLAVPALLLPEGGEGRMRIS